MEAATTLFWYVEFDENSTLWYIAIYRNSHGTLL